jgi:hypothetical protein
MRLIEGISQGDREMFRDLVGVPSRKSFNLGSIKFVTRVRACRHTCETGAPSGPAKPDRPSSTSPVIASRPHSLFVSLPNSLESIYSINQLVQLHVRGRRRPSCKQSTLALAGVGRLGEDGARIRKRWSKGWSILMHQRERARERERESERERARESERETE